MKNTRLASCVILKKGNDVLMLRRKNTGFEDGKFTFPSGKLNENESFSECAKRETLEEVGVILNNLEPAHVLHRKKDDTDIWVDIVFISSDWKNEPENKEPHKCDKIEWFHMDKLPENTIGFIRHAVEQIRQNKTYSEYGWD
jgi:mutator protein MutT